MPIEKKTPSKAAAALQKDRIVPLKIESLVNSIGLPLCHEVIMSVNYGMQIALNVFLVIALHIAIKKGFSFYRSLMKKKEKPSSLDQIFEKPLLYLLWTYAIFYGIIALLQEEWLSKIRDLSLTGILLFSFFRWKTQVEKQWELFEKQKNIDPGLFLTVNKFLTACAVLAALMTTLHILGVNVLPLLAFGGVGAAMVGFAAKDVIANFFGGCMLYLFRPFVVGEEIVIQKENLQGVVETIGWYLTTLRDKDKRAVYLPNALFSQALVINCSRMTHRKIEETFFIESAHLEKMSALTSALKMALSTLSISDRKLAKIATLERIENNTLGITIELYTTQVHLEDYRIAKQQALLTVLEVLRKHQIPLAPAYFNIK